MSLSRVIQLLNCMGQRALRGDLFQRISAVMPLNANGPVWSEQGLHLSAKGLDLTLKCFTPERTSEQQHWGLHSISLHINGVT